YYVLYVILCVSYAILCLLITMQCLVMSFLHINHCLRIARVRFMHPLEITFVDCITFILHTTSSNGAHIFHPEIIEVSSQCLTQSFLNVLQVVVLPFECRYSFR